MTARKSSKSVAAQVHWKLIMNHPTVMLVINPTDGRILAANFAAAEFYGWNAEKLQQMTIAEINTLPAEALRAEMELARTQQRNHFEFKHWLADGRVCDVEVYSVPFIWKQSNVLCSMIVDVTETKQLEQVKRYQQLTVEILGILNNPAELPDAINHILAAIKRTMKFDAVGIRLQKGEDFPYFEQQGFSDDFLLSENTLLVRDKNGGICRDENGNPYMECTCGLVLTGKTEPSNPLFTAGGSAWTNDSALLLGIPADLDPRLHPRNRCVHEGYSSVALVPVRANREIIGLLQLNDRKKDRFTPAMVGWFEEISSSIGTAFLRMRAEERIRFSEARYHALVEQSSEALALVNIRTREVVEVNRRYTELLGYSLPEDAPLYVNKVMIGSQKKIDRLYDTVLKQQRVLEPEALIFRHKNGTEIAVERAGAVISIDGRDFLLTSIRDMTAERRRQAELAQDVEFARRVQRGLLPELPESPFVTLRTLYHPSLFVSGDSYHLEWHNEGKLLRGFLVDVSGHGLATAIQTASINVLIREAATSNLPLIGQMRLVNTRAAKYFTDGAYAAILGFELDLSLRELRYVGAGITQFYANGNKVETPGMFVGIWDDAEFMPGSVPITTGDCFHFLTDGFADWLSRTENTGFWSPGGKDFDVDVAALDRLAKSGTLRDDASAVCLKVREVE